MMRKIINCYEPNDLNNLMPDNSLRNEDIIIDIVKNIQK